MERELPSIKNHECGGGVLFVQCNDGDGTVRGCQYDA